MSFDQEKTAKEFPSEEALQKYLKDHPRANKSRHTVKKKDEGGGTPSSDSQDRDEKFKGQWSEALSRQLGHPATKEDLDVLRGQMVQYVRKEKAKDKPAFDKTDEGPKPDKEDPFTKQWEGPLSKQLGRPVTRDDIDVLRGQMRQFVQRGKLASTAVRVAFRFLVTTVE